MAAISSICTPGTKLQRIIKDDIIYGVEEMETLKIISSRLATKWRQPYSRTCGYVKIRIAITLVRATHWCIRVSRVPAHQSDCYSTLDVPARPRVRLPPLGVQATGYTFQGCRCLHAIYDIIFDNILQFGSCCTYGRYRRHYKSDFPSFYSTIL